MPIRSWHSVAASGSELTIVWKSGNICVDHRDTFGGLRDPRIGVLGGGLAAEGWAPGIPRCATT